ncbi:MAG: indolepyruvate ferredoxin oxidoreductase subunit alpha [Desulfovibrio sp.]|nr:indolepyruvate ferredoxin oxidoreductase subunit alpha [Desulfovibrio sp.]
MGKHPLLSEKRGEKQLLLGNEAIVRGALEAGVNMITCYPGTPSSEVVDTFRRIGGDGRYKMEYSVNEKVAMEVACGAALAGAMSLVTMKHVGLNVAADPLFTTAYTGLPGGLVVLSADDPGCHSSQNEQDNRGYARMAHLPCFEPASAEEARAMTRAAFALARDLQQPVLLRTTTRVSHMRGAVTFHTLPQAAQTVAFEREPMRYVPLPAVARKRHAALNNTMQRAQEIADQSPFNTETSHGNTKLGIIASGVARDYLADALVSGGWTDKVDLLELGMTWPLPEKKLTAFLTSHSRILVLEEGANLLERDVRALCQRIAADVSIEGKDEILTDMGEYSRSLVMQRLAKWFSCPCPLNPTPTPRTDLPGRPPNLCPGCSHRSVYYAARQVFGDDAIYSSDIGCYTLGVVPPMRMADFLFCMGSSISGGSGFSEISDKTVVSFIGDSTFFHSGMTGLANAVFNKHKLLLIILDNGTTAMTGHQPNPGMLQEALGEDCSHLDIEQIVRAFGVTQCKKVSSYNVRGLIKVMSEFKDLPGIRVLIAQEPCVLYARRTLGKRQPNVAEVIEQNEDTRRCLKELACPAFYMNGDDVAVDQNLCSGCMVCLQVAPKSFKAVKREGGRA